MTCHEGTPNTPDDVPVVQGLAMPFGCDSPAPLVMQLPVTQATGSIFEEIGIHPPICRNRPLLQSFRDF